ncbi:MULTISPECIES: hypothetical protein [unclassified Wenzhouxiangella]|uniref:hypothetical protein n=1 Tax=unclassified Wenzhouxiangella TaxID=2613841 RepID=UPI000E32C073|nr:MULTISPECIES: hypothetical protein [unclassified Wenzhouxiangella]RFF28596.1 hypothetical protein DZK25_01980 [Wenzhouxiangella sp. 15181]RFP68129.1 hypothetical protein DZK26_09565 [Wenzhouxiangella sp. 15190]
MSSDAARPLEDSGPEPIRAPLFAMAVEDFEDDRRHVVLDLGRAREGTVALFSGYRCRLDVVDLPAKLGDLPDVDEEGGPEAVERWLDGLLPPTQGESVDLVLCWNLLNYLPAGVIEALGRRLAERASPQARLHALIEYRATRMPAVPASYAPVGLELVDDPPEGDPATVAAPRYSPKELEKRLPGFTSEKTMLLGNGMQEYLYRR